MARLTPLPAPLRLHHPAAWLATWFGSGLLRPAPGTWGTLAAFPFALGLHYAGGPLLLLVAAALLFIAGIPAATAYCRAAERDDASEVVVDEVVAIWLVLAALPLTPIAWISAFFLFRFFDILKPWPIRVIERRFKGGFGVMIDDVFAALLAVAAWYLLYFLWMIIA
ncbi:MAG: phosphatidylglycerophosphatase A [Parvibaculaceae bacterium]|nr:phosphatidylglycerophosphatase A [Parvibaculaceae bacterium]